MYHQATLPLDSLERLTIEQLIVADFGRRSQILTETSSRLENTAETPNLEGD